MGSIKKIVAPAYQRIAVDIANSIADGKYTVGQRISGRTTLASHYGVSPETIRKAVCILQDVGVLSVTQGSGIEILSLENTIEFIEQYQKIQTIRDIRRSIYQWSKNQKTQQEELLDNVEQLLSLTERYDEVNPFTPFRFHTTQGMQNVGKTSSDLMFWQNTGATIIAIKRGVDIILSPGPYAVFHLNDIIYFIGEKECYERVKKLFMPEKDG